MSVESSNSVQKQDTFTRFLKLMGWVILTGSLIYLINYLADVLLPFLVACVFAYVIHPFVNFNKRTFHIKNNVGATLLTLTEVILAISIILCILIPFFVKEITDITKLLEEYARRKQDWIYLPGTVNDYILRYVDSEKVEEILTSDQMIAVVESTLRETWNLMTNSVRFVIDILSWCIMFLYLIFLLIDYDKIENEIRNVIPKKHKGWSSQAFNEITSAMRHYFRAQSLIATIVGVLFAICFYIIDLPLAIVLGLTIGVMNMVPYLQLVSIPFAAMLGLVLSVSTGQNFWIIAAEISAIYIFVQCFQDFYLTPRIMGKQMGLSPVVILLSLSIWGALLGFIGLILALPLTAVLITYYRQYVKKEVPASTDEKKVETKTENKENK